MQQRSGPRNCGALNTTTGCDSRAAAGQPEPLCRQVLPRFRRGGLQQERPTSIVRPPARQDRGLRCLPDHEGTRRSHGQIQRPGKRLKHAQVIESPVLPLATLGRRGGSAASGEVDQSFGAASDGQPFGLSGRSLTAMLVAGVD